MSKSTRNALTKAFNGSALVKIGNLSLGFFLTLVLARLLSPEGYGIYSFVFALITLAAIPAQMGIPEVVIRETAKFHAGENWDKLKQLWRWSFLAVLTTASIAIFISLISYFLFASGVNPVYKSTFFWGLFLLPFMAFSSLRGAMLSGLRRVVIGQLPDSILRPAALIFLVLIYVALGSEISPADVMFYHVIAAIFAFLIGSIFLLKAAPSEIKHKIINNTSTLDWTKSAIPLALISGMYVINQQLDILFLGWLSTSENVGIYKVISQIGAFVIFGQQMVRGVIGPEISRCWSQNNLIQLEKVVQHAVKITFGIAIIVSLIFLIFGKPLLRILFGEEYSTGYLAMIILCGGQLINACFGSLGNILSMSGHAKLSLIPLILSIIINCLLNILLIPMWGLEGAATAAAISIMIWNFMLWRIVKSKINIRPTIFKI